MDLVPKLPPGRANRKALAFAVEIHRLRAAGYSFEAIRLALREAGVEVSCTTVKREAAKRPAVAALTLQRRALQPAPSVTPSSATAPSAPAVRSTLPQAAATSSSPASFVGDSRSGKEIAEAFVAGHVSNPLMQERIRHEGRRD